MLPLRVNLRISVLNDNQPVTKQNGNMCSCYASFLSAPICIFTMIVEGKVSYWTALRIEGWAAGTQNSALPWVSKIPNNSIPGPFSVPGVHSFHSTLVTYCQPMHKEHCIDVYVVGSCRRILKRKWLPIISPIFGSLQVNSASWKLLCRVYLHQNVHPTDVQVRLSPLLWVRRPGCWPSPHHWLASQEHVRNS